MEKKKYYSVNKNTEVMVKNLIIKEKQYGLIVYKGELNCTIIDAGIKASGSIEAGVKISEICMGGLGNVSIVPYSFSEKCHWNVNVYSANPVIACLGSQYAGWSLKSNNFFSLGSGPARAIANREEIFKEISYSDKNSKSTLILECNKEPPEEIVMKVSKDCQIDSSNLVFIITPTTSIAGNFQVVSRVLEVAIHKCHELRFPLDRIMHGIGTCPFPPLAKNMIDGMGRTNDSIIYGGIVQLTIDGSVEDIIALSKKLPSNNSKDYGKPFKQIFEQYEGDFYKIDGNLFSPAKIIINSIETGETFISGEIDRNLIHRSFFQE